MIMSAFFNSQFSYCPLIWMFYGRIDNDNVNKLHEKYLRIIYSNKSPSYEELLGKDSSVSLHHRNLHILRLLKTFPLTFFHFYSQNNINSSIYIL